MIGTLFPISFLRENNRNTNFAMIPVNCANQPVSDSQGKEMRTFQLRLLISCSFNIGWQLNLDTFTGNHIDIMWSCW